MGHSLAEHTGELELRLEAASLGELFVEAAVALADIMAGPIPPASGAFEHVSLRAPDRDALLVDWLNELVFLAERDKKVFADVRIELISDHALTAVVCGSPVEQLRLHVKAATFHGLEIRASGEGFSASVVLDV